MSIRVLQASSHELGRGFDALSPALGPEVAVGTIPEQRFINGVAFPLVLVPGTASSPLDWKAWVEGHQGLLSALLDRHGAILFRGFPLDGAEAFGQFMRATGVPARPYVGGAAPRHAVAEQVFTTNESPPSEPIPFHHEMALVASPPSRIAFFCELPPASGGETPLLHSAELYDRVAAELPEFTEKLISRGLQYSRVLSDGDDPTSAQGRGWQSTYTGGENDREKAEAAMRETGIASWEWLPNGELRTLSKVQTAVSADKRSGRRVFFNAVVAVFLGWNDKRNRGPDSVHFGDGSRLDEADVRAVDRIMQEIKVAVPWQKGDTVLVDNFQAQHSRNPFVPPRKILAYLFE